MRAAVLAFALAAAGAATAQESGARWYVQLDNDVVFETDRWYTSGVRVARVCNDLEWGIVQEIYTPDARNARGRVDRAPVGRLLASVALHDRGGTVWQTIEGALGVRGPAALGRQSTDAIHRIIPAPEVDWSRQLDNRVDAQVAFARSHLFERWKAHYGVVAGNQVAHAHAGAEVRLGANPLHASPLLRFAPTPPFSEDDARGWSAYFGASARAVVRNELLSRNYDPFGDRPSRRRAVGRVVAGAAWSDAWGAATFEVAQDSREFDGQHAPHRFGALTIHLDF